MCLIIASYKVDADYPLVIAANRDEFYQRPTQPAQFWPDCPSVLAGKDLEKGGSWFGLDKYGRVAAVTNYRDGLTGKTGISSRGLLVSQYLQKQWSPTDYLEQCMANLNNFDGFNLLLGDSDALYFLSSREDDYLPLRAGIYGISNGNIDAPWPKVVWLKQQLSILMEANQLHDHDAILALLADQRLPDDERLPDTGIGHEWERILAPVFIRGKEYGTRASTVLTIDKHDNVRFSERAYNNQGKAENTSHYEFTIEEHK